MLGGCLRTVGCATLLVVGAAVAWFTRDRWYPALRDGGDVVRVEAEGDSIVSAGADRAENALRRLESPRGPAYVNVAPADLAALIVRESGHRGPLPLRNARAGTDGDRLWLRGALDLRELRGSGLLGTLGSLLGDEEEVELRGTLDVLQPGQAEFLVESFKVRDFALPAAVIPRLIRQIQRERPPGVSADAVAFAVPAYIGDVRVANGRVTLYKTLSSS